VKITKNSKIHSEIKV